MIQTPPAPQHLKPATAAWWKSVTTDFDLEDHHLRLLQLAGEAWDRAQDAREAITEHGTVYNDRFDQPRARPEVAIERDSRVAFTRLLRELALDVHEPSDPARPSPIVGRR